MKICLFLYMMLLIPNLSFSYDDDDDESSNEAISII